MEPNITQLNDPANVKWKKYVTPGIQIPTEWGKEKFEKLNQMVDSVRDLRIKVLAELKSAGKTNENISKTDEQYMSQIKKLVDQIDDFIFNHPLKDKIGVFEGANYVSNGFYRPTVNSMMHRFDPNNPGYGIVNEQAIIETIKYYTGKK